MRFVGASEGAILAALPQTVKVWDGVEVWVWYGMGCDTTCSVVVNEMWKDENNSIAMLRLIIFYQALFFFL